MDMIINEHTITIPPYISTSWNEVASVYLKEGELVISLHDGDSIAIPNLSDDEVERIFTLHSQHLEEMSQIEKSQKQEQKGTTQELPFKLAFGPMNLENFGMAMQHNPAQMDAPDLPPEVLEQIGTIAKKVLPEDPEAIPKAEPHCNCFFCQLARTIHSGVDISDTIELEEEPVSEEELQFQQWDVEPVKDEQGNEHSHLLTVKNRLAPHEEYKVSLDPMGCTCGHEGCDHIVAALRS